jgi:hypothetical protein
MSKVLRTVLEADLCAGIKAETALESNHIPVQYSLDDDLKVQLFKFKLRVCYSSGFVETSCSDDFVESNFFSDFVESNCFRTF